jgi:predicted nucleotidyltransferase
MNSLSTNHDAHRGEGMNLKPIHKDTILQELRIIKPKLEKLYGVTRIGVFGSVARNEADQNSDIDIVVEMTPDLFKRAALKVELEALLDHDVDVVRYQRRMNNQLRKRIDAEALSGLSLGHYI